MPVIPVAIRSGNQNRPSGTRHVIVIKNFPTISAEESRSFWGQPDIVSTGRGRTREADEEEDDGDDNGGHESHGCKLGLFLIGWRCQNLEWYIYIYISSLDDWLGVEPMSLGFDCISAIHVIVGLGSFGSGVMEGEYETGGADSLI